MILFGEMRPTNEVLWVKENELYEKTFLIDKNNFKVARPDKPVQSQSPETLPFKRL